MDAYVTKSPFQRFLAVSDGKTGNATGKTQIVTNSVAEAPAWSGNTRLGGPPRRKFIEKLGLKNGMKLLLLQVQRRPPARSVKCSEGLLQVTEVMPEPAAEAWDRKLFCQISGILADT